MVEESDTLFLFVPFPAALSSFVPPASSELICSAAPGLRAAENQVGTAIHVAVVAEVLVIGVGSFGTVVVVAFPVVV